MECTSQRFCGVLEQLVVGPDSRFEAYEITRHLFEVKTVDAWAVSPRRLPSVRHKRARWDHMEY